MRKCQNIRRRPTMPRRGGAPPLGVFLFVFIALGVGSPSQAQEVQTSAERVISMQRGGSAVITVPDTLVRVSVSDPEIAEAVVVPPRQIVINGNGVGSTSLVVWGRGQTPSLMTLEVTADVASLERQLDELFPDVDLRVATTGTAIVLSGTVRNASVVRRALELANTTGATVVNNIQAPSPEQILLHVQFAEITQSVLKRLGGELIRVVNPEILDHAFDRDDEQVIETMAEGFVNLMVSGNGASLEAIIRALKQTGDFRSLAEPNLIAREGEEASFLAGGEFPFPVIQGGQSNAVTITWKEFGVRLNFTPTVTNTGNIRLRVAPEVSALDFANGLSISGFQIPSLRTRRVETDVELAPGQYLAIGGLLDSRIEESINKIPILGDIPILGSLFRSREERQERTELLVLVRPHIVQPSASPPELPTGDVRDWEWDGQIRDHFDSLRRMPGQESGDSSGDGEDGGTR